MKTTLKFSLILAATILFFTSSVVNAQSLKEAHRLLENESYTNALLMYNALVKEEPTNMKFGYFLSHAYLHVGELDSAKKVMEKYSNSGADPYFMLGTAAIAFREKNLAIAKDMMNQSLAKVSAEKKGSIVYDRDFLIDMADALYTGAADKEVCEIGVDAILKNLSKDPKDYELLIAAGKIYYAVPDGTSALKFYKSALDIKDNLPAAHVGYGQVYRLIKQFGSAEIKFQDALKLDPAYAPAYREIAEMNYDIEDYAKAIQFYKEYLSKSEKTAINLRRFAIIQYNGKDYKGTIATTKEYLAGEPKNADMLVLQAYAFDMIGDSVNTLATFDKYFSTVDPAKVKAYDYELYGLNHKKMGNDSIAVKNFEKAVALDSTKSVLLTDVAAYYFKKKDWDATTATYKRKEKLENGLSQAEYFALGRAYYFGKKYQEGVQAFDSLISQKPDFALAYYWKGNCQSQMEVLDSTKLGLARPTFQYFIQLASPTPEKFKTQLINAYDYLGYFYAVSQDNPEFKDTWAALARDAYEKILAIDPENKGAQENLKNIPAPKK
ncbi:MAG: tetratricopeptide repeat protein [Ignavibacteriales bacterium]|nr:tetratricopeptide repeat protein [Ignavibacteriales bacterium]